MRRRITPTVLRFLMFFHALFTLCTPACMHVYTQKADSDSEAAAAASREAFCSYSSARSRSRSKPPLVKEKRHGAKVIKCSAYLHACLDKYAHVRLRTPSHTHTSIHRVIVSTRKSKTVAVLEVVEET